MGSILVDGLSSGGSVYIHYKKEHFDWHRRNSSQFDFSGIEKRYQLITLNNYKKLAEEARDVELSKLKGLSPNTIDDLIATLVTFDNKNLDKNMNKMIRNVGNKIRKESDSASEAMQIITSGNTTFSLEEKTNLLTQKINKLESLVEDIKKIDVSLSDYLLQQNMGSGVKVKNLNGVLVDKASIQALNRIQANLNAIKSGISKNNLPNFFVDYQSKSRSKHGLVSAALLTVQDDLYEIARDISHSLGVAAINEVLQELNGSTVDNVKIEVKKTNRVLSSVSSNSVKVSYNSKDFSQISFKVPTGSLSDSSKKVNLSSLPVPLKNYLHQVRWQARYLMFNGMVHNNMSLAQPFYNYIASRGASALIKDNSFGNNYLFLQAQEELISISDFYQNVVNSQKFPTLSTSGVKSIPNKWTGKKPSVVNDDLDELRNIFAWKRAKEINKAIQNLQTKIVF